MAKIGTLSYDINGVDNLRKILEDDKKLAISLKEVLSSFKLNANTNTISSALNKSNESIKSINSEVQKLGTIDLTSNINKMLARLTEIKSEMSVYKQLMLETSNISKKLEIKSNLSDVEKEAESLMRQIQALDNAERGLNKKGSNNQTYYSMSDESTLKQMSSYYRELERETAKMAIEEAKIAKEAAKVSMEKEKAAKISQKNSMKEEATQAKLAAAEIKKAAKEKEAYARAQEKAMAAVDRERIKQESLNKSSTLTNKTMFSQNNLLSQLSQAAGIYFSIYQVGSFIKSLYTVSGEFEKQKVSLAAILQNTDQAGVLFERIKSLAVKSPFQFSELVSYTKQLSAFSVPYNELYDTTKRLADVSAGLGVDMSRLVLAYGQVRSASVLRGQELRQFTEAGIPLIDELAKKFTKLTGEATSAGDVFDKISRREVSFEMVKDIFTELTSEGGKFYNFQAIQAETLSGKLSNLKDSYQLMLNSIGEGNSGVMKDSVDMLTNLMNHWEDVAKILKTLIVTYGTYKAILITVNAVQKINLALQGSEGVAALMRLINLSKVLTTSTYAQVVAQSALNAVMAINPIYLMAGAIAAVIGGLVLFADETQSAEYKVSELNKAVLDSRMQIENLKSSSDQYIKTAMDLNNSYSDRYKALQSLQSIMPSVFKNLNMEKLAALGVAGAYKLVADQITNMEIGTARTNFYQSTKLLVDLQNKLKYENTGDTSVRKDLEDQIAKIQRTQASTKKEYVNLLVAQNKAENNNLKVQKEQSGWREEVNKLRQSIKETDIAWGEQEGFSEYAKKIREGYDTASTALKEFSKTNKFSSKEYASNKQQMDDYAKVAAKLGINLKEAKKTHVAGAITDPIYNNIKRQIDIIDAAKTAYDSYLKFVGEGRAAELVKKDTGIDFSKESATQKLEKLSTKGMLPKNVESTKARIAEITVKYDKKSTLDGLKEALDATIKFVNDNKDRYNLYNELFDITGNKDLAKQLSFGSLDGTIGAYADYIRSEFDKLLTKQGYEGISFDKLIGMSDEDITKTIGKNDALMSMFANVKQAINEQKVTTVKSMAQIISDSKTIEQRVSAINAKYDEQIRLAKESGQTQEFINQAEAGFNEARKKEMDETMSSLYQLSPFYRELFGELSDISYWHLKSIKDDANKIMDEIANSKDSSGKLTYGSYNKDTGKLEGYTYKFTDDSGKIQTVTISLKEYAKTLNQVNKIGVQMKSQNPFGELTRSLDSYNKKDEAGNITEKAKWEDIVLSKAAAFKSVTSELGGATSELFSAFGNDKAADAVGFATDLAGSASDIATGIASGNPVQVVTAVIKGITTIAQYHDKKLQRAIENSKREVQKLQSAYESLAKVIERQLGAATESQLKNQVANLKKQQAELYKQRQAERDKKKTDESAVQDYTDQIREMADKLKYYYEDLFSSEYGNTIKDWASSISSALVDAFSNGTDAAEAFDTSVSDIVKGLAKKMIQLQFIEPAMQSIRTYLFGANGVFNDGSLSTQDMSGLIDRFSSLKDTMGDAQTAWNAIAEAAKKNGIDIGEASSASKSGITANVQSLTEDTGNILASYINAIRADLSVVRSMLDGSNSKGIYNQMYAIMQAYYPNVVNTLALQQAELVKIQNNTFRSAESNDGILNAIEEVRSTLKKATTSGSGTKLNV